MHQGLADRDQGRAQRLQSAPELFGIRPLPEGAHLNIKPRAAGCGRRHFARSGHGLARLQRPDFHPGGALFDDAEFQGGRIRQVDDPVAMKRPPVIDPDHKPPPVFEIGNPHIARQRQARMRGAQRVHVIGLAAGGAPPVKFRAIPGGHALFDIAAAARHDMIALAEHHVGGRIAGAALGLIFRYHGGDAGSVKAPGRGRIPLAPPAATRAQEQGQAKAQEQRLVCQRGAGQGVRFVHGSGRRALIARAS